MVFHVMIAYDLDKCHNKVKQKCCENNDFIEESRGVIFPDTTLITKVSVEDATISNIITAGKQKFKRKVANVMIEENEDITITKLIAAVIDPNVSIENH